jgi:hypothetical protein
MDENKAKNVVVKKEKKMNLKYCSDSNLGNDCHIYQTIANIVISNSPTSNILCFIN